MSLSALQLARTLRTAATLPAPQARALVAALLPIQCGARTPRRKALAAQHYARRAPKIADLHEGIQRQLGFAESETLRKIDEYFRRAPGAPIQSASGAGVALDLIFDLGRFAKGLLGIVRDTALDVLLEAGEEFFDEIGRDDAFTMPDPVAREYLGQRENLLSGIPDDMHAEIEAELQRGLDAGDSRDQLARRITNKFSEIEAGRAETIASTEISAAYGYARHEAMRQAGILFKSWLTSGLSNVRTAHRDAEDDPRNARLPVDEAFYVGGERLAYPGDPTGSAENVINCHCVELAAV